MKRLLLVGSLLLMVAVAALVSRGDRAAGPDETARAAAIKLWGSLSDEQKKLALKDINDKERYKEEFPPVKRPGLPFSMLTAQQKKMVEEVVRGMTSEYGAQRCLEVAKQTAPAAQYLFFFGEPGPNKAFAWRMAMHHLTLLYAEFGKDKANEFGPVLLGGNPVNKLWDDEENLVLSLFATLTEAEHKAVQGKGGQASGGLVGKAGIKIGDLGEKARDLAKKLLAKRLEVFSGERRKILEDVIQQDGGADGLRFILWGKADKSHRDGGSYHWRIGNSRVVCDWQTQGKNHIHMTVRARAKG